MNERTYKPTIDLIAAALCGTSAALALFDVHTPVRPAVVAIALVLGTGWAATCWIDLREPAFASGVAIAVGLSIIFLVSLLLVEAHWWHPVAIAGILLLVAFATNIAAALHDSRLLKKAP